MQERMCFIDGFIGILFGAVVVASSSSSSLSSLATFSFPFSAPTLSERALVVERQLLRQSKAHPWGIERVLRRIAQEHTDLAAILEHVDFTHEESVLMEYVDGEYLTWRIALDEAMRLETDVHADVAYLYVLVTFAGVEDSDALIALRVLSRISQFYRDTYQKALEDAGIYVDEGFEYDEDAEDEEDEDEEDEEDEDSENGEDEQEQEQDGMWDDPDADDIVDPADLPPLPPILSLVVRSDGGSWSEIADLEEYIGAIQLLYHMTNAEDVADLLHAGAGADLHARP